MERGLGIHPLRCRARTHALLVDARVIRIRCRDRNCPDSEDARRNNAIAVHCYDVFTRAEWTEFEAKKPQQEH